MNPVVFPNFLEQFFSISNIQHILLDGNRFVIGFDKICEDPNFIEKSKSVSSSTILLNIRTFSGISDFEK